ncbi:MAG: hypothetical protein WDM79_09275 [Terricaulis sp.]
MRAHITLYLESLYSRTGALESGVTDASYGIGNSLQPRAFFGSTTPFDSRGG